MGALAYMNMSSNKKIAVIGLGVTGHSCVRWFLRQGYEVSVFDTRESVSGVDAFREEFPGVELKFGALMLDELKEFDSLVCSPGVSVKDKVIQELMASNVEVIGDIEVFAREIEQPVIAITGSNGKTTVTSLVGEMFRAAGIEAEVAGNIGIPVLDLLADDPKPLYVLELSSFQLETTSSLSPSVAVVLNVSPDHMDRYDSFEEYVAAKARIFQNARTCVVNRDDPLVMKMSLGPKVVGFTLAEPAENDFGLRVFDGVEYLCKGEQKIMPLADLSLPGRHNAANALAALAICDAQGVSPHSCVEVLRNFAGLPHRSQLVAEADEVRWINDSKGTNVGATLAAVAGMDGPVVLIAGGQAKGQDFSPLAKVVADKARAVLLFGEDAPLIEQALSNTVFVQRVENLQQAIEAAHRLAQPGDSVLFSPACASFDMFRNYIERGETFVKLVEEELQQ